MSWNKIQINLPGVWSALTPAFWPRVDATEVVSTTWTPLSLCHTHVILGTPGFLSSRHQTPIKDRARAKAVTSAAWNKAARPTAPACQLPDESWRVLWNYDKNSASRPPTNPCPLCILHWQERWASLEKRVVSMLALVGGLKDLWTVGRLWCGNKSVRTKLFVPSSNGCLDKGCVYGWTM